MRKVGNHVVSEIGLRVISKGHGPSTLIIDFTHMVIYLIKTFLIRLIKED